MMFWRERERENKEQNAGVLCGQVRVLVVGDSGVGKTSLVHLILKGSRVARPPQTIGCTVSVKHTTYGNSGSSSSSLKGDSERDFFIELWDVSGHERYKDCRSLFYSQINGIIFVHDLSQRRTKTSLQKWAAEIAATGSFSAPLGSGGPGGLPVPYIVIGNKADIAAKEGTRGSSGKLVDVARQWVEKQGLIPSRSSEELPLTESFPSSGMLIATAKEARYDKEGVMKFFRMLIRRRYFSDEVPAPNPWSIPSVPRPAQRIDDDDQWSMPSVQRSAQRIDDDDQWSMPSVQRSAQRIDDNLIEDLSYNTSGSNDPYKYKDTIPPLPAQRTLTPPPTLYPQQPVSVSGNYSFPRFSLAGSSETSAAARTKRSDIDV